MHTNSSRFLALGICVLGTVVLVGVICIVDTVSRPSFSTQVNDCTIASQELRNAAFNANPPDQHVVTTVDGLVAQDYYSTPRADPALATYQANDARVRMTAAHCSDNPVVSIAVWANPYPDWSRATPSRP